jgi:hypothetical protein
MNGDDLPDTALSFKQLSGLSLKTPTFVNSRLYGSSVHGLKKEKFLLPVFTALLCEIDGVDYYKIYIARRSKVQTF